MNIPDFNLTNHVILISGAARGLGLTLAEALLEAGAKVYALDHLPEPVCVTLSALYYNLHLQSQSQLLNSGQNLLLKTPEFIEIQQRAQTWHSELQYRCIDVRDTLCLNAVVEDIANHEGRIDGLIAAAAIQQETPALEYSAKDSNALLEVNVTGVFMTAQAVARQMVRFGNGGSIVLVASMSGTVVNRVCWFLSFFLSSLTQTGLNLPRLQRKQSSRNPTISQPRRRMGRLQYPRQHPLPGYILAPMLEMMFVEYPERRVEFAKENMLGRLSRPREYRGAAVFLLSNASSFMTGSDLRIDGGHAAW
ncbi:hypothetical protein N7530_011071 [Penicillium desertorum]|uniref:Uncharacterized protein n=1 Tax=Penicillium desertorum TaxID=1303715 RepID=A0A9X0BH72_9EURO|nr:hypothetical protein N7530_011071 [Penicillium desertorum]